LFSHFSLHRLLIKSLREQGLRQPTPVQIEAIPLILDGMDLQVTAETGSGKTVAYLAPALHQLLTTAHPSGGTRLLVVLPTRELAQQVFKTCQQLTRHTRLSAGLIYGGEAIDPQYALLADEPAIVIATTGRLLEHIETNSIDLATLEILVLDEADRMLDMGFSDDVLKIVEVSSPKRQTLLFSATMNNAWLGAMANKVLREPEVLEVSGGRTSHSAITEQVMLADNEAHKQKQLLWLLSFEPYRKAIVFTNSRVNAERLGSLLQQKKYRVVALHGDVLPERRKRVMERLDAAEAKILVATDVAARGLDIDGVDLVINFDMPRRGDDYVHRIGRTGRGGEKGVAITLVQPDEWNLKASVERYLKHTFEPRLIEVLQGQFKGPKKLRASGKTVGNKKKKEKGNRDSKTRKKAKQRKRLKQSIGKRRAPGKAPRNESST